MSQHWVRVRQHPLRTPPIRILDSSTRVAQGKHYSSVLSTISQAKNTSSHETIPEAISQMQSRCGLIVVLLYSSGLENVSSRLCVYIVLFFDDH